MPQRLTCRARAPPATLRFQASLDGQTWQTLRRHQNDASLAETAMSTAAWPVAAAGQAYRHFRSEPAPIGMSNPRGEPSARRLGRTAAAHACGRRLATVLQTGTNSSGTRNLMCAGIELYGRATFERGGRGWLEP